MVLLTHVIHQLGLPIYSEIHEGTTSDPLTLIKVLDRLLELNSGTLFSEISPAILMERGIATLETLLLFTAKRGFSYVAAERTNKTGKHKGYFHEIDGFGKIADHGGSPIWLRKIETEDSGVVLCKSAREIVTYD